MNKILHINVGAHPFSIDEQAFEKLDLYLISLKKHFEKSEGCDEIMQDIESRLAELFQERMAGRSIVNLEMVDQAIAIMGSPEAFGAQWSESDQKEESFNKSSRDWGIHTGKRFYRDPQDRKIAGVCSGLAHYFGIEETLWVRLAFGIGIFMGGFAIPVYIILWVITPEAIMPSERLAMKGEPINVQNIAKKVEEELDRISDNFDSWRERRKNRKKKWRR